MNNGIWTIAKKELRRFFGDRRMLLTTLLLPGLTIYIMYSFMGMALENSFSVDEDQSFSISAVNLPDSAQMLLSGISAAVTEVDAGQLEEAKTAVSEQQCDLLLCFPEQFDALVEAYSQASGSSAPNIEIYYNSASTTSATAYSTVTGLLSDYEEQLVNKFNINDQISGDLATEEETSGSFFAMMMPMLLMIFLFSGSMATATESIAGEKERGTIATMLVTPVRRSDIAFGKIIALSITALLSGLSSAIGTILSFPKLMNTDDIDIAVSYTAFDYLLLGLIILSTVLILVAAISIISAFAKSIKEAQTLVLPLMIAVMALGITAMFGGGAKTELFYYLIPLYNSVQCMVGIFSYEIYPVYFAVTIIVNLCCTLLGALVLAKMFNSEKIIFSK